MHSRPTQAVILAGGRGTRLAPLTDNLPKALISFHGKPFLGYVVEMLREQGFERVLLLLGYMADAMIDHFGDGSDYGVEISYRVTDADDLTAFRVKDATDLLDDRFLLLYCDNYWPMQFDRMWRSFVESGAPAQITVYANADGYTRDSVIVGEDGFVTVFDARPHDSGAQRRRDQLRDPGQGGRAAASAGPPGVVRGGGLPGPDRRAANSTPTGATTATTASAVTNACR